MHSSVRFVAVALLATLAGCPSPTNPPPPDTGGGTDAGGGVDAGGGTDSGSGTDTGTPEVDGGTGVDGGEVDAGGSTTDAGSTGTDAPVGSDSGVTTSWTDCREAVVFGLEGEACSFTGSCVECTLVTTPRQVLCMAGRLRVAAAGAGACSGGTDAGIFMFPDAGAGRDAGVGVDAGGICPPFVVPPPPGAACLASTVDCIRAGGDAATCIRADAACLQCVQTEIQACATSMGCDDEAGEALCCFNANCPDQSCYATTCATDWNAYSACVSASPCSVSDLCFPSAPACPPAAWPAPTMPGCTSATLACIMAATTSTQFQACLDADTTGTPAGEACNLCIINDLFSCSTDTAGCDDELGLVQCCLETACPTGDGACRQSAISTGGACVPDWDDFVACVDGTVTAGDCGVSPACFP